MKKLFIKKIEVEEVKTDYSVIKAYKFGDSHCAIALDNPTYINLEAEQETCEFKEFRKYCGNMEIQSVQIAMTKEVRDILQYPLESIDGLNKMLRYQEKENKELIIKKRNYKINHERLLALKMSVWERIKFLFTGV